MNSKNIKIEKFKNIFYIKDKKGRVLSTNARYASCFIITLRGQIKFTFMDRIIVTNSHQGVFIPQGTAYTNECLENAESILINFYISNPTMAPCALNSLDEKLAMSFYREISQKAHENTGKEQYFLLSRLYQLAYLLFQIDSPPNEKVRLVEKALFYMQSECERADLQIDEVAAFCNISAVYLRKIVKEVYHKTPFHLLTDLRMKKASEMLLEKRPIKEIASSVGYSDIYQFSRAYKRYFGYPPSTIDNNNPPA